MLRRFWARVWPPMVFLALSALMFVAVEWVMPDGVVTPAEAQGNVVTFESITFADTAVGFTATTIRPSGEPVMTSCRGKLETGSIRFRFDGTAPTASVGALVDIGDEVEVKGLAYLSRFQGIRTTATSGTIQFHCVREP